MTVAADAGADAVVVHHPHVPSPVRVYVARDGRKVPIFESVGNLVSNQGESYRASYPPVSPQRLVSLNGWTRFGVIADLEWAWPAGAQPSTRPSLGYGFHFPGLLVGPIVNGLWGLGTGVFLGILPGAGTRPN